MIWHESASVREGRSDASFFTARQLQVQQAYSKKAGTSLLLQEAGTISDTVFAKYLTQAPIRTARCLPCFRQEPTVGMLRQFRLDDVVAHFISISGSGPIKSRQSLRSEATPRSAVALGKTSG